MLVLTRMVDESIVVGDPHDPACVIRVVRIGGDRVRLGIESTLRIDRRENVGVVNVPSTKGRACNAKI